MDQLFLFEMDIQMLPKKCRLRLKKCLNIFFLERFNIFDIHIIHHINVWQQVAEKRVDFLVAQLELIYLHCGQAENGFKIW